MKNTDKNSQKDNDSLTLLYIFFFLLLAVSIGGITYYFINKSKGPSLSQNIVWINDTNGINKNYSISSRDLTDKSLRNHEKKKKLREKLAGSNQLISEEKNAYWNILDNIEAEELDEDELEVLEEKKKVKIIDKVFNENSKLERLEQKIDLESSEKAIRFYKKEQPTWWRNTFPIESEGAIKNIDETFTPFYQKFLEQVLSEEKEKLVEELRPKMVKNELTTATNLQQHVNYLKTKQFKGKDKETGEIAIIRPGNKINFLGFTGFLEEGDKEPEKTLLGVTIPEGKKRVWEVSGPDQEESDKKTEFSCGGGKFSLQIKLKKELLFSRLGKNYDRWINNLNEGGDVRPTSWADISWETLVETIAHELAHAVIETVRWKYEGSDKGGHGSLHTNYTKRIREMIENSSEYKRFEQWWKEKW